MEILKVSMEEATGLITVVFHAEKALEAKKFFKELFGDDDKECEQPQCQEYEQHPHVTEDEHLHATEAEHTYEECKETPTGDEAMCDMP